METKISTALMGSFSFAASHSPNRALNGSLEGVVVIKDIHQDSRSLRKKLNFVCSCQNMQVINQNSRSDVGIVGR